MKYKKAILLLTSTLVILGAVLVSFAQSDFVSLYTQEGPVIHQENVTVSSGRIRITGYRVEKVKLKKPLASPGGASLSDEAFRLVIVTAEGIPMGQHSVWINETRLEGVRVAPNEIAAIVLSMTIPSDTLKLALSSKTGLAPEERVTLPGFLFVPPEYVTPLTEIEARNPLVTLTDFALKDSWRGVRLSVEFPGRPCTTGAVTESLSIGGKQFPTFCDGKELFLLLSSEDFAGLKDGAEIILFRGVGNDGEMIGKVGPLDKTPLNGNPPSMTLRPLERGFIQLRIDVPKMPCAYGAIPIVIEIGINEYSADCADNLITHTFSRAKFASVAQGAQVAVKRVYGRRNADERIVVGNLDKSSIR